MLPKPLRDAILAHYQAGQNALSCSPEYREALRAVLAWVRERQAETERQAELEALMTRTQGSLW
jgi:hypothetical protein